MRSSSRLTNDQSGVDEAQYFLQLLMRGIERQPWCFVRGAFVLQDTNQRDIFQLLVASRSAYVRISSHKKRFEKRFAGFFAAMEQQGSLEGKQFGLDMPEPGFVLRCRRDARRAVPPPKKVRTALFFVLPANRLFLKFETHGTKKPKNILMHAFEYVRTRFDDGRTDKWARQERHAPFDDNTVRLGTRSSLANWNLDSAARAYHKDRVGREVFLSIPTLVGVLEAGLRDERSSRNGRDTVSPSAGSARSRSAAAGSARDAPRSN